MKCRSGRCVMPAVLPVLLWRVCVHGVDGVTSTSGHAEVSSYCHRERFHGQCADDEVIMMTSAEYGRMRISRCVTENFGYLGCSERVLDYMESRCSGRVTCNVPILDVESFGVGSERPCHTDLKRYLEAGYSCVKALKSNMSCVDDEPAVLTNGFGYISGGGGAKSVTSECDVNNRETTWRIRALPGQRVNITLYDFSAPSRDPASNDVSGGGGNAVGTSTYSDGIRTRCRILATVREDPPGRGSVKLCGGEKRLRTVYVSIGHEVELRIWHNRSKHNVAAFLLQYEFIGCAEVEAPPGGWTKRDSDLSLLVGCLQTKQTWRLVCNGTQWAGTWQNCSTAQLAANGDDDDTLGFIQLPMKVSVVIIVGLALAIGLLVLGAGLICLKRLPRASRRGNPDGCRVAYGEHQQPPSSEPLYPKATIVYRMRDTQTATSLQYAPSAAVLPDYTSTKNLYSCMSRHGQSSRSRGCCSPSADEPDPDLCTCNIQQQPQQQQQQQQQHQQQLQQGSPNHGDPPPDLMCSTSYHALDPLDVAQPYFDLPLGDRRALHFEPDSKSLTLSSEGTLNTGSGATVCSHGWESNSIPKSNPTRYFSITAHYSTNISDDCLKPDNGESDVSQHLQRADVDL